MERRIHKLAGTHGISHGQHTSHLDFCPCQTAHGHREEVAGMSEREMRQYFREEQREGIHPSLRGKKF